MLKFPTPEILHLGSDPVPDLKTCQWPAGCFMACLRVLNHNVTPSAPSSSPRPRGTLPAPQADGLMLSGMLLEHVTR